MVKKTHIIGGLTLAAILEDICFIKTNISPTMLTFELGLYYSFSVMASLVPDIDRESSSIGRKLPKTSKIISDMFGHRTVTHSILFVILTYYLMYYLGICECISKGIVIGLTSHILLDLLNFQGVCLLYPLRTRYRFSMIKIVLR